MNEKIQAIEAAAIKEIESLLERQDLSNNQRLIVIKAASDRALFDVKRALSSTLTFQTEEA